VVKSAFWYLCSRPSRFLWSLSPGHRGHPGHGGRPRRIREPKHGRRGLYRYMEDDGPPPGYSGSFDPDQGAMAAEPQLVGHPRSPDPTIEAGGRTGSHDCHAHWPDRRQYLLGGINEEEELQFRRLGRAGSEYLVECCARAALPARLHIPGGHVFHAARKSRWECWCSGLWRHSRFRASDCGRSDQYCTLSDTAELPCRIYAIRGGLLPNSITKRMAAPSCRSQRWHLISSRSSLPCSSPSVIDPRLLIADQF